MEKLEKQAIELLQMMCGSTGCVISDSGGKDSSVLKHIALREMITEQQRVISWQKRGVYMGKQKRYYQEVRERENHKRAVTKEYTELDGTRRTRRQL